MVSRLNHENFVELLGYCVDGNLRILAYEFASNGSLHDILHGKLGSLLCGGGMPFFSLVNTSLSID